jgi:hypothetical protein
MRKMRKKIILSAVQVKKEAAGGKRIHPGALIRLIAQAEPAVAQVRRLREEKTVLLQQRRRMLLTEEAAPLGKGVPAHLLHAAVVAQPMEERVLPPVAGRVGAGEVKKTERQAGCSQEAQKR